MSAITRAQSRPERRGSAAGTILSLVIAIAAGGWALTYSMKEWAGIDFYQFWAGSHIARRPEITNLYSAETRRATAREFLLRAQTQEGSDRMLWSAQRRPEFEFFSTPFLYTCFGVFGDRYERAFFAYRLVILAAFVGGTLMLARAAGLANAKTFLLLAFLLTLFEPLRSEIRVGNVNSLQLLMIAVAVSLGRNAGVSWRWIASGAVFGVAVAFKPNVILVVPLVAAYRLIRGEKRRFALESAGVAGGVAAAVTAGAVYFGTPAAWLRWIEAAVSLSRRLLPLGEGNVAPFVRLAVAWGSHTSLALAALLVALVLAALWDVRRELPEELLVVAGCALVIYLMSATLVWMHYLILAVPLGLALIADSSPARSACGFAAMFFLGGRVWNPTLSMSAEARLFWTGVMLLFATAVWRIAAHRTLSSESHSFSVNGRSSSGTRARTPRPVG